MGVLRLPIMSVLDARRLDCSVRDLSCALKMAAPARNRRNYLRVTIGERNAHVRTSALQALRVSV